ncbi:MAG: YqgE/AlgH family protein [Paludisphaera borealis]|uniref:YqgE/AlgH family protein n=1 Tax=Paludisphaera borealis TaxID=1387353 RepID=UPI0028483CA8|nr:YqgE/AlgH family protein [Paludisphaera borealis]MDR3620435.1 YqgE/AlgH family protein [Paludisphaera borealis]
MATQSLKGHLLIATPEVHSSLFARSVVLMVEHTEDEGAKGIILNLPTSATMTDLAGKLFDEDFVWDKPLHLGGPVAGPLLVLHTDQDLADLEVVSGVYMALDAVKSQHLISMEVEPSLVVANFSCWAPGQLEDELSNDVWLTTPADTAHIFLRGDQDLWQTAIRQIRADKLKEIARLREPLGDPSLN